MQRNSRAWSAAVHSGSDYKRAFGTKTRQGEWPWIAQASITGQPAKLRLRCILWSCSTPTRHLQAARRCIPPWTGAGRRRLWVPRCNKRDTRWLKEGGTGANEKQAAGTGHASALPHQQQRRQTAPPANLALAGPISLCKLIAASVKATATSLPAKTGRWTCCAQPRSSGEHFQALPLSHPACTRPQSRVRPRPWADHAVARGAGSLEWCCQ